MGWEVILEKEMATHCSILAWKMPCTEEPDELQSMGSQRVRDDWAYTHTHTHTRDDHETIEHDFFLSSPKYDAINNERSQKIML